MMACCAYGQACLANLVYASKAWRLQSYGPLSPPRNIFNEASQLGCVTILSTQNSAYCTAEGHSGKVAQTLLADAKSCAGQLGNAAHLSRHSILAGVTVYIEQTLVSTVT